MVGAPLVLRRALDMETPRHARMTIINGVTKIEIELHPLRGDAVRTPDFRQSRHPNILHTMYIVEVRPRWYSAAYKERAS